MKYGRQEFQLPFDDAGFDVLLPPDESPPLTDVEIGERFDDPLGSKTLEEIVLAGETVLFVVPDATRSSAAGQIINLLVRRLIANGSAPHELAVIFATGIHRSVTDEEKRELLTPFIAQRLKTIDHASRDLMRIAVFGEIAGGIQIELNRALTEFDHIVTVGSVNFHYFAGFTGGRKLICPGLASAKTISATHRLAFDRDRLARTEGVGPGLLDGNPVHEAFTAAASKIKVSFAVHTIVDNNGYAIDLYCGEPYESHQAACSAFAKTHTVQIEEKRDLVIASCGGDPHDLNLIQAHKSIDAAAAACLDGGTILLAAECADGTGRSDFIGWFDAADSRTLAERLCERYQVNGQTAWSLLTKAERFKIRMVTLLGSADMQKMRLEKISFDELKKAGDLSGSGYIIPFANKIRIIHRP